MKLFGFFIGIIALIGLMSTMPQYLPYKDYFIVFALLLFIANLIIYAATEG